MTVQGDDGLARHEFVEPPETWGDFCWQWNEDEESRCGWSRAEHVSRDSS